MTTFASYQACVFGFPLDENDTPDLIEVNLRYVELDFHQLNNGPLWGNDLPDILGEVLGGGDHERQ